MLSNSKVYIYGNGPYVCNRWRSVAGLELEGGVSFITVVAMAVLEC